jgi:hypothetical protein
LQKETGQQGAPTKIDNRSVKAKTISGGLKMFQPSEWIGWDPFAGLSDCHCLCQWQNGR